MSWGHIEFYFKKDYKDFSLSEFKCILHHMVLRFCKKRKFYLFEPTPDCFLAIEDPEVEYILKHLKDFKADFIKKITYKPNTEDIYNGEGFLNVMDAVTNHILFTPSSHSFQHIIHCCFNAYAAVKEKDFYENSVLSS